MMFSEGWYCRSTDHSAFGNNGDECSLRGESAREVVGWSVPADLRQEIVREVVDFRYLSMTCRKGRIGGLPEQDALALMKLVQADTVEKSITACVPVVKGEPSDVRALIYKPCNECGSGMSNRAKVTRPPFSADCTARSIR